jgi:hypothetical protein
LREEVSVRLAERRRAVADGFPDRLGMIAFDEELLANVDRRIEQVRAPKALGLVAR